MCVAKESETLSLNKLLRCCNHLTKPQPQKCKVSTYANVKKHNLGFVQNININSGSLSFFRFISFISPKNSLTPSKLNKNTYRGTNRSVSVNSDTDVSTCAPHVRGVNRQRPR